MVINYGFSTGGVGLKDSLNKVMREQAHRKFGPDIAGKPGQWYYTEAYENWKIHNEAFTAAVEHLEKHPEDLEAGGEGNEIFKICSSKQEEIRQWEFEWRKSQSLLDEAKVVLGDIVRIKDLWLPPDDKMADQFHHNEGLALISMRNKTEALLEKLTPKSNQSGHTDQFPPKGDPEC